jgi:hypothetical protein
MDPPGHLGRSRHGLWHLATATIDVSRVAPPITS